MRLFQFSIQRDREFLKKKASVTIEVGAISYILSDFAVRILKFQVEIQLYNTSQLSNIIKIKV